MMSVLIVLIASVSVVACVACAVFVVLLLAMILSANNDTWPVTRFAMNQQRRAR